MHDYNQFVVVDVETTSKPDRSDAQITIIVMLRIELRTTKTRM